MLYTLTMWWKLVVLDWHHLFDFLIYHLGIIMTISLIWCQHGMDIWWYFDFWNLSTQCMQKHPYLSKIVLVSIFFAMMPTQIITQIYKDFFTLIYPLNINILTQCYYFYAHGEILWYHYWCWLVIPTHSPTYSSNIDKNTLLIH